MAKKYVPEGAFTACDKGTSPSTLRVTFNKNTTIYSMPMATEADLIPFFNLKPMGFCTSPLKWATGLMCIPTTPKWDNPKDGVKINGNRLLLEDSTCDCIFSGKIKIFFDRASAAAYGVGEGKMPTEYIKEGFDWLEKQNQQMRAERDSFLPDWMKPVAHVQDWFTDLGTGLVEGAINGVVGLGETIYQVAQDPVGTAEALYDMGKKGVNAVGEAAEWVSTPGNMDKAFDDAWKWGQNTDNWKKLGNDAIEGTKNAADWVAKNPRKIGNAAGEFIPDAAAAYFSGGSSIALSAGKKVLKEGAEELVEKAVKEGVEEATEKAVKEGVEEATEKAAKEGAEALGKKTGKELLESLGDDAADIAKVTDGAADDALKHADDAKPKPKEGTDKSGCNCGDPVDPITGHVFYPYTDFEIPGPLPLKWEREYNSGSKYKGILGYGISSTYDVSLIEKDDEIELIRKDGTAIALNKKQETMYHASAQVKVIRKDSFYEVFDYKERLLYVFSKVETGLYKPFSIQDEKGFSIQFHFSGKKLLGIIDSAGRQLKVTSNDQGFITKIEFPTKTENRVLVEYEYDSQENMIAVYDGLNQKTTIEYDYHHRMTKKTDRNGQSFYWEYNAKGQCILTWGDGELLGIKLRYEDYKTEIVDSTGFRQDYHYNQYFKNTKLTDAYGNSKIYHYNEKGLLVKETDEENLSTEYKYDDRGNLIKTELSDGRTFTYTYDEENRLILSTDPSGNHKIWVYDEKGRLESTQFDNNESYFFYNSQNLVAKIRDQFQEDILLEYDESSNLTKMTLPTGAVTEWKYNDFGECTEVINPLGKKQQFEYDRLGRLQHIKLPTSEVIDLKYDAYDSILKINGLRNKINFTYTPLGSVKSREENGVKVTFDYDKQERLKALSNEQGDQYTFSRNKRGEIVQEVSFDGITKYYNRDRAGKVIKIKREGNRFTEYEYDKGGRIIRADYHDGYWEAFAYNKAGFLIKATTPDNEVFFLRDGYGRVTQERQGEHIIDYQYDDKGQLLSLKSSLGADVSYERDRYGQISAITAGAGENPWVANIRRNMLGLEIERTLPGGVVSSWSYDAENNPVKQTITRGQERTLNRTYSWNANQQLHQQLHQITNGITGGITEFGYDAFQSLAWAQYEDGSKDLKMPDEVGSLFRTKDRKDRIYGKGGKLLKDENWYYNYDTEGNLKLKSKRNIAEAQLQNRQLQLNADKPIKHSFFIEEIKDEKPKEKTLDYYLRTDIKFTQEDKEEYKRLKEQLQVQTEEWQHGDWLYTWQANGMLKSVKKPDGSIVEFEYDALGRRTAKIVQSLRDTKQSQIHRFVWDGNVLLHEWNYEQKKRPRFALDGKGEFIVDEETVENLITWVYEDGSLLPSAKIIGDEKYSVISDYIGRPIQACNEKGEKVWETDYDIYGRLRNLHGEKQFVPFRQLGQYEDEELDGLYYNRFRYYDSNVGNYISQDPIGLEGNNPNFYAYTYDSNRFVDVFGLKECPFSVKDKITQRWLKKLTGKNADEVEAMMTKQGYTKSHPQAAFPEKIQHTRYTRTTKAGDTYSLDYHPGGSTTQPNIHGNDYWKVYKIEPDGSETVLGRIGYSDFKNYDLITDSPVYKDGVLMNPKK